jgi:hypothetical protein
MLKSSLVAILKKNIRKMEIKKNKKRAGYKYIGLSNTCSETKFSTSKTRRALPEDQIILKKSKKVEYLIIPAYVLNRNINKILTAIITNIFWVKYSRKFISTLRFFKKR